MSQYKQFRLTWHILDFSCELTTEHFVRMYKSCLLSILLSFHKYILYKPDQWLVTNRQTMLSGQTISWKKSLPLLSESFFRQKATAAAERTPAEASPARWDPAPVPRLWRPPLPPLSSQYWSLLRPLLARAAQELRRFSRLDSHLGARWWYCTDGLTLVLAVSSVKIPFLKTREVDTMGLRLVSAGVSRMTWHAAPVALVWSTRLHGDRLRDLRAISLVGTEDNMAIDSPKTMRGVKCSVRLQFQRRTESL